MYGHSGNEQIGGYLLPQEPRLNTLKLSSTCLAVSVLSLQGSPASSNLNRMGPSQTWRLACASAVAGSICMRQCMPGREPARQACTASKMACFPAVATTPTPDAEIYTPQRVRPGRPGPQGASTGTLSWVPARPAAGFMLSCPRCDSARAETRRGAEPDSDSDSDSHADFDTDSLGECRALAEGSSRQEGNPLASPCAQRGRLLAAMQRSA